jgi:F0F1-type ATP synthase membrane subunit b/b'
MVRIVVTCAILVLIVCWFSSPVVAQVSKEADKRVKEAETTQAKSWDQVDQINKQTDQTNARLNQSRQSANPSAQQGGYSVKKKETATVSPYSKKAKPQKKAEPAKEK